MSAEKKYAIVCFVHESQVEVVPTSWLVNDSSVKWPSNCTVGVIMKFIRECKKPEESWNDVSMKVLGFAKSFSSANRKATVAQDTSNIGTDSSQSEVENATRKRFRPKRIDDSSTDEEIEIKRPTKKKMFSTPNPPSLREIHPSTSKIPTQSQETLSEIHSSLAKSVAESQETLSVSLISGQNAPLSTPPKENAMLNRVFKCLENIQREIKHLKADQVKILSLLSEMGSKEGPVDHFGLPTGISIPVETDSELLTLNSKLKEERSLTAVLARYLFGVSSGKTMAAFILCITKKVLSKTVALQYSRLGRKGKKRFESVEEVFNAILAAAALKFTEAGREELAEKFGRVLASACDWDGSRSNKKTLESTDNIDCSSF